MSEAMSWFKSLSVHQRIGLKEASHLITGMTWEDYMILFSPRQRLEILHQKLTLDKII